MYLQNFAVFLHSCCWFLFGFNLFSCSCKVQQFLNDYANRENLAMMLKPLWLLLLQTVVTIIGNGVCCNWVKFAGMSLDRLPVGSLSFLCTTAATAVVHLSHHSSVRPSVTRMDQSRMVQARITKSLPSAAWKTLVSGTVKLFHKFERGHPERGR